MITRHYKWTAGYVLRLLPALLGLVVRGIFAINRYALGALLRISLLQAIRWLPSRIRAFRDGRAMPVTLQVVDDIQCKAGCAHCVFTSYKVRGPGLGNDVLDDLYRQAADMGVTHVYMMGSDPFYRDDVDGFLDLLARHRSQIFYLFTEGKRVTEAHLDRIRRAGNIVPLLNIDGLRESTDRRKGEGSFDRLESLAGRLRDLGIPWFVTTMISRANQQEVTGDGFLDWLRDRGAWLVAYVPYTPADTRADADQVLDRRERDDLFRRSMDQVRRRSRPIVLDMLGIEQNLTACPSALHTVTVLHDGTVVPCPALPFGTRESNIHERSLRWIFLHDPLYEAIRLHKREQGPSDHCMFYGDPAFIRQYLRDHREDLVIFSPAMTDLLEES